MEDEYLTKCVVDPVARTFRLYSNEGDEKIVKCDSTEQFMNVLNVVRESADEDVVSYTNPL